MKDCVRFQNLLESLLADELAEDERKALDIHLDECTDCRQIVQLHRDLTEAGPELAHAAQQDLDALRHAVLMQSAAHRPPRTHWRPNVAFLNRRIERPLAALAASLLLLAVGAGLGRFWPASAPVDLDRQDIVREISDMAASHRQLADVENSAFIYSNVAFRKLDEGRVALNFDVTTHVESVEPLDSPLVREVLVQSLLHAEPDSLGSRLKAISYAESSMDAKVRDALVLAMHGDENLAVRLKALSILSNLPRSPLTEAAFLQTLREDESVQMRLLALDYLANQGVDPGLIRRTIEEAGKESNPAVLLQAASYER